MEDLNDDELKQRIGSLQEEVRALKLELKREQNLEEQLRQAQRMEALANLAGGIAHDFNNILQTILGYTQLLLMRKPKDHPDIDYLTQIEQSTDKGGELTRQLLTFGRKIPSKFKQMDINAKVREITNLLRRTIPRMIDIDHHLAEDLKMLHADPVQIEQVLMNLSINANDAMPSGGSLSIRTENRRLEDGDPFLERMQAKAGEYVLLSVSDTGAGMAPDIKRHIFEPFFTTKEKGKGTGLGLSMVYAIVRSHEGFIDCLSKVGAGTTFSVYLPVPLSVPKRTDIIKLRICPERATGGEESILIVDDEEAILKIGKHMLQNHGYTVTVAGNGEEALYKFSHSRVDLVILDVGMPGIGGIKCLQELLSMDPQVKVLISSGYEMDGRVKEALEMGAKHYLAKPYAINELLKAVRKALDSKQACQIYRL